MIAVKTILFFLCVPLLCIGVIPVWLVLVEPALFSFSVLRWLAVPLWLAGWAVLVWACWSFTVQGRGTPSPLDPPRVLVVSGPYRFVRNPIYLAATTVLVGYVLWSPSLPILLMPVICISAAYLFVRFYEEKHLARTFGPDYDRYCRSVPGWFPGPGRTS